jgi:hypothetical protein
MIKVPTVNLMKVKPTIVFLNSRKLARKVRNLDVYVEISLSRKSCYTACTL